MSKEELKDLLKENLVVELYETYSGGTKNINVEIRFDGDIITQSDISIGSYNDC
jgi:hypothetical protein